MSSNRIFVSYSHDSDGKTMCEKVIELFRKFGLSYWLDVENGVDPSAENYNEIIERAINDCYSFVCVWTSEYKNKKICKHELQYALSLWDETGDEHAVYILQMEKNLDTHRDFPPGLNFRLSGRNYLQAFDDTRAEEATKSILDSIESKLIQGINRSEFIDNISERFTDLEPEIPSYVSTLRSDIDNSIFDYHKIANALINGKNIFIHGERGIGKTTVVKSIYYELMKNLKESVANSEEKLYIPVLLELEKLWVWNPVSINTVLFKLCQYTDTPYCTDTSISYVILLDGELSTVDGDLPPVVDQIIDRKSSIFSVLIAQTELQILDESFSKYSINKLSFPKVIKIINDSISDNVLTLRFYDRMLYKAFCSTLLDCPKDNECFITIRRIYEIFKNEEKSSPLNGIKGEDFYSDTLANSTQNGRLPSALADNEIEIWKKLITGNEVFMAIRNPFYLRWLINLYLNDDKLIFPYRLKTLQVKICQTMIDRLNLDKKSLSRTFNEFLIPLAKFLLSNKQGNTPIPVSSFKDKCSNTSFDRIKGLLVQGQIINIANNDIVFRYDFLYDYFINFVDESDMDKYEDKIRICPDRDLLKLFISYVKSNGPFEEHKVDSFETAADIVSCERDSFRTTSKEHKLILSIAEEKIRSSSDYRQKASILNGIGKLFGTLELVSDSDYYSIENSEYWIKLDSYTYISKYPVTCYHYDGFTCDGYTKSEYWVYGRDSLRMKNGVLRTKPLTADIDYPVFHISNHPMVGVSWYEALAYCAWLKDKIRLKSGLVSGVRLPMISEIKRIVASFDKSKPHNSKSSISFECTTPVGTFDDVNMNTSDIVGNVWEWSMDYEEFYGDTLVSCYGGAWNCSTDSCDLFTTYPARLSSNNIGFRVIINTSKGE